MRFISIIISSQLVDLDGAAVAVLRPDGGQSDGRRSLDGPPKPSLPAFRRGTLFKLIQDWKSRKIPIPVFNHKTHKEVAEFLNYYGKSGDGQFGLDKIHIPIMEAAEEELIPSGIITDRTDDGSSEIGIITSPFIWKQGKTGVYAIKGIPLKVIKYHAYCWDPETDPYDSIVVESYFMNRLAREAPGMTLNVDFYSGYVFDLGSLPEEKRKLLDVKCPPQTKDGFEIDIVPRIRYMIMDKVGPSLKQYMMEQKSGRIPFFDAIQFGVNMIRLLQRLHHLNIIHGDVHMGNFAFKTDDVPSSGLILIDFGRSEFVDTATARQDPALPDCWLVHPNAAWWEMKGCKVSFRSDVYRAVQMTAMSLYGVSAVRFLDGLMTPNKGADDRRNPVLYPEYNLREFLQIKKSAEFWELSLYLDFDLVLRTTPPAIHDRIRGHLRTVSEWITNCTSDGFYTKPNYDGIIAEYDAILRILEQ